MKLKINSDLILKFLDKIFYLIKMIICINFAMIIMVMNYKDILKIQNTSVFEMFINEIKLFMPGGAEVGVSSTKARPK